MLTPLSVVTTSKGPHRFGAGKPSMRARKVAGSLAVARPYDGAVELDGHEAPLLLDEHFKAAEYHSLAVERHGVLVGLHARVGHDFLVRGIAHLLRRPDDPGEYDCLIGLTLDGHGERRELAFGNIVAPTFDHLDGTMLLEKLGRVF